MIEPLPYEIAKKGSAVASVKMKQGEYVHARMDETGFTHLVCACTVYARKLWCPHVEKISTEDSLLLKVSPEWAPAVVVFRTPGWLIVPVLVVPPAEDGHTADFYRVDVLWGNPRRVNNEYEALGGETIGYIGKYDRRRAIRSMILEWLPSLIYRAEARKCESLLHSAGDSYIEVDAYVEEYSTLADEYRRKMLTEAYNILDTGKCVSCTTASVIPF